MESETKKSKKSILPAFCFSSEREEPESDGDQAVEKTNVYLNVYDLGDDYRDVNHYLRWAGFGFFHSGIEVHGLEYCFGALGVGATSGEISRMMPRQHPLYRFRKSILMGTTAMDGFQCRLFVERIVEDYSGQVYHIVARNCNHFSDDLCYNLTGKKIPRWVNRIARVASKCNCILPEELKTNGIQHCPVTESQKKKRKNKKKQKHTESLHHLPPSSQM